MKLDCIKASIKIEWIQEIRWIRRPTTRDTVCCLHHHQFLDVKERVWAEINKVMCEEMTLKTRLNPASHDTQPSPFSRDMQPFPTITTN